MDQASVLQFLACLKAKQVQARGKWVVCACPLAPWRHDSGKDTSPSFAIRVEDHKQSYFNCFACQSGKLGDLVAELVHLKGQALGMDLGAAYALVDLEDAQKLNLHIKEWGEQSEEQQEYIIPEWWLKTFPLAWPVPYAREYLQTRMVTEEIAHALDIRWDRSYRVVCFPVRNRDGELVSMRGRFISPKPGASSYHVYPFMGQQNGQAWLGESTVDFGQPVLMAESVFDLTSCRRVYDNVVSPMSVGINAPRMQRMAGCVEVVTLFDHGKGGDKARHIVTKHLGSAMVNHLLPSGPKYNQPDAPAKDAGEMTGPALRALLGPYLKLKKAPPLFTNAS